MDDITVVVDFQQKGDTGPQGIPGKSAYQIAVDNGFPGTQSEWLLSLQGKDATGGGGGSSRPQDQFPTQNSTNDVMSGGVYVRLLDKVDKTTTVNSKPLSGNIALDKTDVGLTNVDNTADTNKPVSISQAAAIAVKASTTYVDTQDAAVVTQFLGGVGPDGNNLKKVNDKADAVDARVTTVQTQANTSTGLISDLQTLKADKTITVNSQPLSGNVVITPTTLGLGNVDNTSDANKPVSTAQATAIALKVDKTITVNSQPLSGNVVITPSTLGLGNVNNTADVDKPISTATQQALDAKVNSPLPSVVYSPGFLKGTTTNIIEYNADLFLQALRYLGSTLKGETIGVNLMATLGTNVLLATGRWYLGMIKIPEDVTLTSFNFMLATAASGTNTGNTKNRIGLYSYNQGGTLTQIAGAVTADNVSLYRQTAGTVLTEPLVSTYNILAGYYFLVFLYGSTDPTAPNLMGVSMGFGSKMSVLTANSARIQGVSLTAGKTDLPSTINFSTDVSPTLLTGAFWGGVS